MSNKPHHGMKGLMSGPKPLNASAHMPLRGKSGGDRKAKTSPTARNGALAGGKIPPGNTRVSKGPVGNSKGQSTALRSGKGSLKSHSALSGRGSSNQMHANRMPESPSAEWFEKLGSE